VYHIILLLKNGLDFSISVVSLGTLG